MSEFTIYPAIDLTDGQVVRLIQGDPAQSTTYSNDPKSTAEHWIDSGAKWLHVVNLDGAFGNSSARNLAGLSAILEAAEAAQVKVQFGGGIRTLVDIEAALAMGISRVVIGTMAVQKPEVLSQAVTRFGAQALVVGIDSRDGLVKTHGWQKTARITPRDIGLRVTRRGIKTVVFTNISRDGVGTGVDVAGTKSLADATGLEVIASGGVASLEDIKAVREAGLKGVIVGRALYDGQIDLQEALTC